MTEPVIAVAAITLVDDGRFTLDEPISEHVPEGGSAGRMCCQSRSGRSWRIGHDGVCRVDFATADADGDGSVSYQEAVAALRRRCGGGAAAVRRRCGGGERSAS
jgi:CubicO group peptidase (beta-lactamase class C family)